MNATPEIKDQYAKEVLRNKYLEDLPDEKWKLIEEFENYAISNYGRVKSQERWTRAINGKEWKQPELIMNLFFIKQVNKYLGCTFYNIHCSLSLDGKKYRKSIARLVYYHFVEKFDMDDRNIMISYKDDNRFHVHSRNLEKISASENRLKTFRMNRARNRNVIYLQPVSQYTIEGKWVADFESMYAAADSIGISCEMIMDVINKEFLTAGKFRWFLKNSTPKKEDFIVKATSDTSEKQFNANLWKKLGKPTIDKNNPPSCMNLSLEDLPDECWKPIHGFEERFMISNKGRVKGLSGWVTNGRTIFLKERILSPIVKVINNKPHSLYCLLHHKEKITSVIITRLLYYCFVENYDLNDKSLSVANQNDPFWEMDISKLSLIPLSSVLKRKKDAKRINNV